MLLLPAEALARTARSAKPVPKKYAMYYDSKACRAVASRSSECNKGKEPFYKFLAKFNISRIFRMSRTKLDENSTYYGPYWGAWDSNSICPYLPSYESGFVSNTVSTFRNVSADSVEYESNHIIDYSTTLFESDWLVSITFQRIDDKWYCTHFELVG